MESVKGEKAMTIYYLTRAVKALDTANTKKPDKFIKDAMLNIDKIRLAMIEQFDREDDSI